jgi:MFS transporter, DHA1 family, inner membrane transport protein
MQPLSRSQLLALAAGNFVIGFGGFVVVGLVAAIAQSFSVSPQEAGRLMTWYAVAYAIGSPVGIALAGDMPRQKVMLIGLGLFMLGAIGSALAPTLFWMELARIPAAFGGGLFTPTAAAIAVAQAAPAERGKTLAAVFSGLTMAQAFGVPAGSWLGYTFGPPAAFWTVAALCVVAAIWIRQATPADLRLQPATLSDLGNAIAMPRLILPVLFTAVFMAAIYVVYTYLAPLTEQKTGQGRDAVTIIFFCFGVMAIVANMLGGLMADRIGPSRTLAILAAGQAMLLPAIVLSPVGLWGMTTLVVLASLFGWSFMAPQQSRLVALDPAKAPLLLALNASAIYVAAALGSALGGLALSAGGYPAVAFMASGIALLSLAWLIFSDRIAAGRR